jgi:hypothetical protein
MPSGAVANPPWATGAWEDTAWEADSWGLTEAPTEDAYLVDFILVPVVDRFVVVPGVGGRFVTVRAER